MIVIDTVGSKYFTKVKPQILTNSNLKGKSSSGKKLKQYFFGVSLALNHAKIFKIWNFIDTKKQTFAS